MKVWRELTSNQQILQWVSGVDLQFHNLPPSPPQKVVYKVDQPQQMVMNELISGLISKEIVVECLEPKFIAGLFLRPKPGGSHRLIVDLSPLNEYLKKEHFKMESLQDALDMLEENDWMCKVDLKNAYYSIPIRRAHQPYLAFIWQGRTWMFTRLCFGLSPAPRIFTKILKPVLKWLRAQGAKLVAYIDDFWVAHACKRKCRELTLKLVQCLSNLGFTVSGEKSIREPVQFLVFLGMEISSRDMTVALPAEKKKRLLGLLKVMLRKKCTSPLDMAKLIGSLEAIKPAFRMCPLYYRTIQRWHVNLLQRGVSCQSAAPFRLHEEHLMELEFWVDLIPRLEAQPILQYQGSAAQLHTDASDLGWGATLGSQAAHGKWDHQEILLHINVKELLAVQKGLTSLGVGLSNQSLVIGADNMSCLAYIRKMGGVRNVQMSQLARQIWELAQSRRLNLVTHYIPGLLNTRPDYLSRICQDENKEWMLNRKEFNMIRREWGPLTRDLFASHRAHQLPQYITWEEDHVMRNAFHHQWLDGDYAFPPFAVIGRVLSKVRRDRCRLVLVTPKWEAQPWYTMLLAMSVGRPIPLKFHRNLLLDPAGNSHPMGESLHLTTWLIDGNN